MTKGKCGRKPQNVTERFWAKVHKTDGCWLWTASVTGNHGYGQLWLGNTYVRAHRFSYELHYGLIPDGLILRHTCDNPRCVNPAHLVTGSQKDNIHDCISRNRFVYKSGEASGSKLTASDVKKIRELYKSGGISQRSLAFMFAVTQGTIWHVLKRNTWGHI